MLPAISYDQHAQAAYVRVGSGSVARTEELLEDLVWLDYDEDNRVLGIELVGIEDQEHLDQVLAVIDRQMRDTPTGIRDRLRAALS